MRNKGRLKFGENLNYDNIILDEQEKEIFYNLNKHLAIAQLKDSNENRILDSKARRRDVKKISDTKDVQLKRMSDSFSRNVQPDSKLESITVSDTVFASRRQIFFKHGRSQSDSTQTAVISSSISSTSSRREKTASGLFSFLRWFRKETYEDDDDDDDDVDDANNFDIGSPSAPSSPQLLRSHSSSCGSVDTLFSTATASSFAFIHPAYYRPFGSAAQAETRITECPETDTYRQRVKQRDRLKELEKDISLKKKYHLFGSGTIYRSVDNISRRYGQLNKSNESLQNKLSGSRNSTLGRKKRRAPPPPILEQKSNDYSLPNTLEHLAKAKDTNKSKASQEDNVNERRHRRTVSDSSKDKKAGAYCHVRGKRKAPPPPVASNATDHSGASKSSAHHSLGKKKRQAPQPPVLVQENNLSADETSKPLNNLTLELNKENIEVDKEKSHGSLSAEDKARLIKNIAKLKAVAEKRNSICTPPSSPNLGAKMSFSICNDTLKLEKGVLKSNKSEDGHSTTQSTSSTSSAAMDANKFTPSSPVSPRPWYKRNIIREHSSGSGKPTDKKKDKDKLEDWMPEVGIARGSLINSDSSGSGGKFNIFSSKSEKNEEKRKSQISMLVNISELDREAAEIVQKEHAKEKAILDAEDAKFYSFPENSPVFEIYKNDDDNAPNVDIPKRSSARELISLFNAITNVTRVTVNSTFFSKEGSSLFSREGKEKRFSFGSSSGTSVITNENVSVTQEKAIFTENVLSDNSEIKSQKVIVETQETYLESPGEKRRRWNKIDVNKPDSLRLDLRDETANGEASQVTIEEIDDFDDEDGDNEEKTSKIQALYEANRLRRHHSPSPSIPTIAEQSETASSVTTSPGSSINHRLTTPTTPTTPTPFPSSATEGNRQSKRISIWVCPQCTLENALWRFTCEACDMWKPAPKSNATELLLSNTNKTNDLNHVTAEFNGKVVTNNTNNIGVDKNIDKKEDEKILQNNLDIVKQKDFNCKSNDNILIKDGQASDKITVDEKNSNADMEEVRKARLAFFHKSSSKDIQTNAENVNEVDPSVILNNIKESKVQTSKKSVSGSSEDEKLKLREMLKDLKHSLPKRNKQNDIPKENSEIHKTEVDIKSVNGVKDVIEPAVKNLGAIKKIPQFKGDKAGKANKELAGDTNKITNGLNGNEKEKAEVYLVKTETIIEDIRMKKQPGVKPGKVSTSVQTSAMIRKADLPQPNDIEPPSKSANSDSKDYLVPITVEEYTIKDGVLYTSLSKEKKSIGKGTFELILARDFAGIKATKTGKGFIPAHVYANVPIAEEDSAMMNEAAPPTANSTAPVATATNNVTTVNGIQAAEVEKLTVELTRPKGLADFKAGLEAAAAAADHSSKGGPAGGRSAMQMMNTVAVNRRLRRLESAIAKGELLLAAQLAKELAELKINCSVTRHKTVNDIVVDMYVEDKVSHQGPIALMVSPSLTVAQLKMKVEREFEIPVAVQRWILGKQLAVDDRITLADLGVSVAHYPIFLYLVAPEGNNDRISVVNPPEEAETLETLPEPPDPPEPIKRGGWYYNDQEDDYSFCEDSESELSDNDSIPASPEPVELVSDYSEDDLPEPDEIPPTPPERQLEPPTPPTGTLKLGWKCEVCTLVNSPTRPGCAACTAPRPPTYQIPPEYQASDQELQRIQHEEKEQQDTAQERLQNYQALMNLDNADVVPSGELFDCPICLLPCVPGDGVVLRDCLHTFCRGCIIHTVQFSEEAEVKCPYRDANYACDSSLLEREIKALVPPDVYEQHLAKSVTQAENKIGNAFHCKTPDCPGWCIFEDNVNEFPCPVCTFVNCLTCQAIHAGINCKQFQERAKQDSETNADARRTNEMLEEMVERGEAMKCPTCQVILMKKWGCDWLRCSMCKTEICWVTRGPRWGPLGKGDITGGCQCGVNGVKCHPKCNYCH